MRGTGKAMREFLYIDDVADAVLFLMDNYNGERGINGQPGISWINMGCGVDITMKELGNMVAEIVGFKRKISFDHIYPNGTPR